MIDQTIATRVAAIEKYLADLPPRRGGRVEFADRIAESIGVGRAQFYTLVRMWTRTRDATRLGAASGVARGTVRSRAVLPEDVARVLDEEIAVATGDVTNVEIRRRVAKRLPECVAPALPTIAKRRARGPAATPVDRNQEVILQALRLSDALRRGVADLSPRQAARAARHLALHLGATPVLMGSEDAVIHGVTATRRRLRDCRTGIPLLVVVTGAEGRRNAGAREIRDMLQKGDHFAMTR